MDEQKMNGDILKELEEIEKIEKEIITVIHQYKNNGYNIVLDVYSGAVHVVDDLCYDVIAVLNEPDEEPTAEILKSDLTWEILK